MTDSAGTVVVCGDVNVDMLIRISMEDSRQLPDVRMMGGGTAGNTAVGLARLGHKVRFIGRVGSDLYGKTICDELYREGIEISGISHDHSHFTAIVFAFIDGTGERHNITWPKSGGAHNNLSKEDIPGTIWENAVWFHTTGINLGESPIRDTTLELMSEARKRKIPVSFDFNLRMEFFGRRKELDKAVWQAISLSDYVFGSADEELIPFTEKENFCSAAAAIVENGPTVVVRRGADGVYCLSPGNGKKTPDQLYLPSFRVPVVDTLGAGDAFNSGFIASFLEEQSLEKAILAGHGCAGWNIGRPGARSLPGRKELLEFIQTTPTYPPRSLV